jgi:hypothetical protein
VAYSPEQHDSAIKSKLGQILIPTSQNSSIRCLRQQKNAITNFDAKLWQTNYANEEKCDISALGEKNVCKGIFS